MAENNKVTYFTAEEDIRTLTGIVTDNGYMVTASAIRTLTPAILSEMCGVVPSDILGVRDVKITCNNGDTRLPTEIEIRWAKVPAVLVAKLPDESATEDLVRRVVNERLREILTRNHAAEPVYDHGVVDDLRGRLDIAENENTMLHGQIARIKNEKDSEAASLNREMVKLKATIRSLENTTTYGRRTESVQDAYRQLTEMAGETVARCVLQSAVKLFQDDCDLLCDVPSYDLRPEDFNALPDRVTKYAHDMLDNLIASGPLKYVTRQMMYRMHNDALATDKHETIRRRITISATDKVEDIRDSDIETAYKTFRKIVNGEVPKRD